MTMSGPVLFLALLAAGGAFLLVDGVVGLIPRPRRVRGLQAGAEARGYGEGRERVSVLAGVPLLDRLLSPLLEDVGWGGQKRRDEIADKLRRSGWKYASVADYYATKVILAGMFFTGGAAFLAITGVWALFWAPLGLGLLGFFIPDREIQTAIDERRRQVTTEMALTLDRLALLLKAGIALPEAIGVLTEAPGGPFIAALRRVGRQIGAGGYREIDRALDDFMADLPEDPEVVRFVNRLKLGFQGTPVSESLLVQAERLRAKLSSRLLGEGLEAGPRLSTVGAFFMLVPLALIILGPPLILAFNVF